ncbi:hypothetical protein [Nocardioides sp.]|uniref:hypothetical protein n=1 Tax=Nocardioides sp. TaxID=35761 RepID=UPI00261F42DA|nr:hypothetical protein [Nocardioides sp.]
MSRKYLTVSTVTAGVVVGIGSAFLFGPTSFGAEEQADGTAPKVGNCKDLAAIAPDTQVEWTETLYNPDTGVVEGDSSEGRFSVDSTSRECQDVSPVVDALVVSALKSHLWGLSTRCPDAIAQLNPKSALLGDLAKEGHQGGDIVLKLSATVQKELGVDPQASAGNSEAVEAALKELRVGEKHVGVDGLLRDPYVDWVDQECV